MASTYSNLKIQLMATGENTTTWGDVTNINLGTALEEAIVGSADVTFASANVTLSLTNTNASQTARNVRLRCTGTTGGSTRNLVVPSIEKPYMIQNDCADSILVKTAAGTGITVPAGKAMWVYVDGTNVVDATTYLSSLSLGNALPVNSGGTGTNALTSGYLVKGNGTSAVSASVVYDNGADIGIGTTSPGPIKALGDRVVQVAAPSGKNAMVLTSATTGGAALGLYSLDGSTESGLYSNANGPMLFWTNSAERMRIDSSGNVGIGNTIPGSYGGRLVVGDPANAFSNNVVLLTQYATASLVADGVTAANGAQLDVSWANGGPGPLRFTFSGTERMRIDSSGNVGIGTNSPASKLDVSGTVTATSFSGAGTGLTGTAASLTVGNATNAVNATNATNAVNVTGTVAVANGGTGATTAAGARTGLGATTLGANMFTLTNPSAVTFPRFNADNTVSALDAATFRSAIGAGTSSTNGTVTSVSGTGTVNGLTLTGTVTSSGNITLGGTLSNVSLTTQVTGTLPIANGGTGATTASAALTALGAYPSSNPNGYTTNTGTVTSVGGTGSVNGLSLSGTVTSSGNITLSGSVTSVNASATINGVTIGYRSIPRSTTTTTATTGDVGKCIAITAGITIPNSTFAAGDAVSIYNDGSTSLTITQASGLTLRQAGTTNTGNRTLAARGMATIWFNSATEAIISGAGVS